MIRHAAAFGWRNSVPTPLHRTFVAVVAALLSGACLGDAPPGTSIGGGNGGTDTEPTQGGSGGDGGSSGDTAGVGGNAGGTDPDAGADAGDAGAGIPSQLGFQPITVAYASYPVGVVVTIEDDNGTVVEDAALAITLSIGNNPSGSNLVGFATTTAAAGVAYFDAVTLDQVGEGYTLIASANGLASATSAAFDVVRVPFERVVTGLYGGIVSHMAISTEVPPTLFATGPAGVFRSRNNGGSWAAANFGNEGAVGLVVVDPANPERVYTTPSFGSGSFSGAGFYATRSLDGGDAWRPMQGLLEGGLSGAQIGTLVIDPVNPNIVYAGNFSGVFRSADGGDTWAQTNLPFANYALTIDPVAPSTLYAYAYNQEEQAEVGFYKTIDSGANWVAVNNPDLPAGTRPNNPTSLLATPTGVFVNGFRSVNGGASWQPIGTSCWAFAYSPANPLRLYCGFSTSVLSSNDGGLNFGTAVAVGGGLINSLAVDNVDPNRVYAATDDGVFASIDGGLTWVGSSVGISALGLGGSAIDQASTANVFIGGPSGVYRTDNAGVTWTLSELGDSVTALSIDSINPSTVYACTLGATFFRSDNSGVSWSAGVSTGPGPYCYDIVVNGTTIWLPTVGGGIRRSTNGGTSFEPTTLTSASYSVAADPTGQIVYAGTNTGTYKSINGGTDWTLMTNDLADALLVDPSNPSLVYMGLSCGSAGKGINSNGGTRRSSDAGANWDPVVQGACINTLQRMSDGRIAALGRGYPTFSVSSDQGQTWQPGGFGIEGEATSLAISSDGQTVYVPSTIGLYKSESGGL